VHPGPETSMHYFSCFGGTGMDSIKTVKGHITSNLYFSIWWDLRFMLCILVQPGHETLTNNFSCSGGTSTDLTKSAPGHVTMETREG
jgi:hypothetical protein